jgi:hypothetical protein
MCSKFIQSIRVQDLRDNQAKPAFAFRVNTNYTVIRYGGMYLQMKRRPFLCMLTVTNMATR